MAESSWLNGVRRFRAGTEKSQMTHPVRGNARPIRLARNGINVMTLYKGLKAKMNSRFDAANKFGIHDAFGAMLQRPVCIALPRRTRSTRKRRARPAGDRPGLDKHDSDVVVRP